jgi:hypothetical protein
VLVSSEIVGIAVGADFGAQAEIARAIAKTVKYLLVNKLLRLRLRLRSARDKTVFFILAQLLSVDFAVFGDYTIL